MEWTIDRIHNYHQLTYPEITTRSRKLNSFTLYYSNAKFEVNQFTPMQRNHWRRENSPQSAPNVHQLPNDCIIILNRRRNRETNSHVLQSVYVILRRKYNEFSNETVMAWKNRARHLNQRDPYVHVPMDHRVEEIATVQVQLQVLRTSWSNMERLLHLKLCRSNRNNNATHQNNSKVYISLPHKIRLKRQVLIKMNMNLSLMYYLFGMDLQDRFNASERRYDPARKKIKVKIYHIKSLRRIDEILCTDTSDSMARSYSCKTVVQRWHYYAAKVYLCDNESNKEVIGYVIDELDNGILIVHYQNSSDEIKRVDIQSPIWNDETKQYTYPDRMEESRFKLTLFEPIIFRFNILDVHNNFWFFANRYTTVKISNDIVLNADKFDINYCS
jgi:hypothetical protein